MPWARQRGIMTENNGDLESYPSVPFLKKKKHFADLKITLYTHY